MTMWNSCKKGSHDTCGKRQYDPGTNGVVMPGYQEARKPRIYVCSCRCHNWTPLNLDWF